MCVCWKRLLAYSFQTNSLLAQRSKPQALAEYKQHLWAFFFYKWLFFLLLFFCSMLIWKLNIVCLCIVNGVKAPLTFWHLPVVCRGCLLNWHANFLANVAWCFQCADSLLRFLMIWTFALLVVLMADCYLQGRYLNIITFVLLLIVVCTL